MPILYSLPRVSTEGSSVLMHTANADFFLRGGPSIRIVVCLQPLLSVVTVRVIPFAAISLLCSESVRFLQRSHRFSHFLSKYRADRCDLGIRRSNRVFEYRLFSRRLAISSAASECPLNPV